MNAIFAVSAGLASPADAPVYVGLGLVALGILALWFRDQCYLAYQWVRPFPNHGAIYVLVQYAVPILVVIAGIGLAATRFVGS